MEQAKTRKIRVLCVDDHAIVIRGMRAAVEMERDMEWAGALDRADKLYETVATTHANIVLMDVDMPGADPFKALGELHELKPDVRTIVLSAFVREHYLDAAVAAGAWGYLSKSEDFEAITGAIRRVARGDFSFPPEFMARCELVGGRLHPKSAAASGLAALSAREVQVLRMIAQGMSTKDIASEIHRSVKRVESIRTEVMRKLGCEDRLELARYAIREGVVEP